MSLPTEPGLYFAREIGAEGPYDHIVELFGQAPFLNVRMHFLGRNSGERDCREVFVIPDDKAVYELSAKITAPSPLEC